MQKTFSILLIFVVGFISGILAYKYLDTTPVITPQSSSVQHKTKGDETTATPSVEPLKSWKFVEKSKLLRVCMEPAYYPLEFKDENKEVKGFDVDVTKQLAKQLEVRYKIFEYPLETCLNKVMRQEHDVVISGVEITPARKAFIELVPYANLPQLLISYTEIEPKNNNPFKHSVGVITSSNSREQMDAFFSKLLLDSVKPNEQSDKEQSKSPLQKFRVNGFDTLEKLVKAMDRGDIEQAIINEPLFHQFDEEKRKALFKHNLTDFKQPIAVAIHPLNDELVRKVSEALAKITKSKEFKDSYQKWFSTTKTTSD